jgi:hypothetical protein
MTCKDCDDGEGACIYPHYGAAPHICGYKFSDYVIGASKQLPEHQWPDNFMPDPETSSGPGEYPGCGVYTHCLTCGDGEKPSNTNRRVKA